MIDRGIDFHQTQNLDTLARHWILEYLILDPKSRYHLCHQSQAPSSSLSFPSSWQCHHPRLDSATLPTFVKRPSFSLDFIRCIVTVLGSGLDEPCEKILYQKRQKIPEDMININKLLPTPVRHFRLVTGSGTEATPTGSTTFPELPKGIDEWMMNHESHADIIKYLHIISDLKDFA